MANRLRNAAKERLWRGHISGWQRSGLSIRAYCLQHQLSEPGFYFWRRELTRRDESVSSPSSLPVVAPKLRAKPASVAWMPVTVTSSTGPVVEVQLPTGAMLRVPAGVESMTLERILTELLQDTQEARP